VWHNAPADTDRTRASHGITAANMRRMRKYEPAYARYTKVNTREALVKLM